MARGYGFQRCGEISWANLLNAPLSSLQARQGNEILKPTPRHAHAPWLKDQEIRGRHSAPGFGSDVGLGSELRESKSAPDLRQPVLAAIRGLQDGSIQVSH